MLDWDNALAFASHLSPRDWRHLAKGCGLDIDTQRDTCAELVVEAAYQHQQARLGIEVDVVERLQRH